jgi:mono/diheme cytochrome c family protein
MRLLAGLVGVALMGVVAFWATTEPAGFDPALAREMARPGDPKAGEIVFWAGGCAACHATKDDPLKLGGGAPVHTPFGDIFAPNISPDKQDGIGGWTPAQFARALYDGVDVAGDHLYPAFPYASYRRMSVADARDLYAFLSTLPPVKGEAPPPSLRFPFNIRRTVGLWKRLYLGVGAPPPSVAPGDTPAFGRYLIEGPGHCGECHTPRDALGGPIAARALSGARMPDGKGKSGDITPAGLAKWSQDDIETALSTGLTPDGDSLGGAMAEVVRNLGHLPKPYITAIARYLKGPR